MLTISTCEENKIFKIPYLNSIFNSKFNNLRSSYILDISSIFPEFFEA